MSRNTDLQRRARVTLNHLSPPELEYRQPCATNDTEDITFDQQTSHGGYLVAKVLKHYGVSCIFTLVGGHISPILTSSSKQGIRVIDVRHEVNTVFAADAIARLTGTIGVAAVTAGPGVANTVTAVKNAQMAQSPLLVLGGATADILKGKRSLQDIDQFALLKPHVKWMAHVGSVKYIVPSIERAIAMATEGVPGPVFLEFPVDVLYPAHLIRAQVSSEAPKGGGIMGYATRRYLNYYLDQIFNDVPKQISLRPYTPPKPAIAQVWQIERVLGMLSAAKKPTLIVGSGAMMVPSIAAEIAAGVKKLGIPTFLSGMARGLLGPNADLHIKHKRKLALKETDLLIMAGLPFDFRLQYGRSVNAKAFVIGINRSNDDLKVNRAPSFPILADPGIFLSVLAKRAPKNGYRHQWSEWHASLRARHDERENDISAQASIEGDFINPLFLCKKLDEHIHKKRAILVGDGGDFVATASYTINPRGPLCWLDPGPFGTLGIGMGMAMAAKLARPDHEVWILFGDGACGFSFMEIDTCVRHNIPVIAVIGNDACWSQIHRDQSVIFQDDTACMLDYTSYEQAAMALGAEGILVERNEDVDAALERAKRLYAEGKTVVINAKIGKTDFRKGSLAI